MSMSGHKDATGYLLALRQEIPDDWFSFACDLALAASTSNLSPDDSKKLVGLYLGNEKYTPRVGQASPAAIVPTPAAPTAINAHLRELKPESASVC
jgi:hypothetical protein